MRNVYNLSIRAWLLSLLCLLVGGRAVANEPQLPKPTNDYITVNDVTLVPGSTDTYQVEISLVGSQIYTAYQMDILFPPGVDVVMAGKKPSLYIWKKEGCIYPKYETDEGYEYSHKVTSSYNVVSDKLLRIACFAVDNDVLTAKSGKLLYFKVKVSPYLKPGDVVLKVTNLDFITKENAQKYHCKDQTLTLHATAESTVPLSVSGSSHYGTCVLPFAVSSLPADVKAYSAKGLDETGQLVVLSEVKQLVAYTPLYYIVNLVIPARCRARSMLPSMARWSATDCSAAPSLRRNARTAMCCKTSARVPSFMPWMAWSFSSPRASAGSRCPPRKPLPRSMAYR